MVCEVTGLKFDPTLGIYSDYCYDKKAKFEATAYSNYENIFLGDSILNRIKEVTVSEPEKVFLYIGTNDLARGKTVSYVAQSIE